DLERGVHRPARVPPRRGLHPPDGVAGAAQARRTREGSRAPARARAPRDDVLDPHPGRPRPGRGPARRRAGRRRGRDHRRHAPHPGRRPAAARLRQAGQEDRSAVRDAAHDRDRPVLPHRVDLRGRARRGRL
ncbi:MAG: hypothetical protein AVDCRST_MAG13-3660, partial [uncultured Solirubrobacteraceae bacterium]